MNNSEMPKVKDLLLESWEVFKESLGNVILLSLIGSIFGFLLFFVAFLGVASLGFLSVLGESAGNMTDLLSKTESLLTPTVLIQLSVVFGIFLLIAIVISSAVRLAIILAIGKHSEKPKLGACISGGFSFLIPAVLMGILTGLMSTGATFLLVVPGIIISFYLIFVTYEIVLSGKKWFGAVRGSVQIMSQHFGEVIWRMLVLFFGGLLLFELPISLIELLAKSLSGNAPTEAVSLTIILAVIRVLAGGFMAIYGIVYGVITYQHAKLATDESVEPKMSWIYVLSIIGWIVAILIGFGLSKFVGSNYMNLKNSEKESVMETIAPRTESEKISAWRAKFSPEVKAYWSESNYLFSQMKALSGNSQEVKKLGDENIVTLKKAIALDENNPELWASLSDAYTWINSKGTLDDALEASLEAESLDASIWGYASRTAEVYLMLERYDEAILKFQQVIRVEDNYARAHVGLGMAYKRSRILDLAKTELQKGIDIYIQYNEDGRYDEEILGARKEMASL